MPARLASMIPAARSLALARHRRAEQPISELLILAPLRLEAALISSGAPGLRVRRIGMGRARSKAAATELLEDQARAIVVMGVCGGLNTGDQPGEVLIADQVRACDEEGRPEGESVKCAGARTLTDALVDRGVRARRGTVACSPLIVHGGARSRLSEWGADVVEMESIWLAPGARGRPLVVIRVVADTPVHDLRRPDLAVAGWCSAALSLRRVARELEALVRERGVSNLFS